jgi:hypothetical protein
MWFTCSLWLGTFALSTFALSTLSVLALGSRPRRWLASGCSLEGALTSSPKISAIFAPIF